jgi:checkpoint serine/threonine-protein kinase
MVLWMCWIHTSSKLYYWSSGKSTNDFCRYVAFINQHHPSSATHLLPVLESTTRKFVDDSRFFQDLRYLKLWVQYSKLVERSDDIWTFLNSREIGTNHALMYEEWAQCCETRNR